MSSTITLVPTEQITRLVSATQSSVDLAKELYVRRAFWRDFGAAEPDATPHADELLFAAEGLEAVGLDLLTRYPHDHEISGPAWRQLIWPAYRLRRSLPIGRSADIRRTVEEVIDGVLANRQPEIRLRLREISIEEPLTKPLEVPWPEYVINEVARAFLLLVRKYGGTKDIIAAQQAITVLREEQHEWEPRFLASLPGGEGTRPQRDLTARAPLAELVASYNTAQVVDMTAHFLAEGATAQRSPQGVKDDLDRFLFTAREVLSGVNQDLRLYIGRLGTACKALIDASVYSTFVPSRTREFLHGLAKRRDKPILELWYAQREALGKSLLDPARTAIVISMPTSAGKTLLAELAILQSHFDEPRRRVVYLAPTRALVTQVSLTLKRDLVDSGLETRVATPSFELNPIESEMLADKYDILVTTPEKMDLLVRESHPAVADISLVIVDEAHALSDMERGARLELLLATLRRERAATRYLLLTPFADNAKELAQWLGGNQGTQILVDWKPNDRTVGAVLPVRKKRGSDTRSIVFRTLESAHSDCPGGIDIEFLEAPANVNRKKELLALETVLKISEARKGGVLLLSTSRTGAAERAAELAERLDLPSTPPRAVEVVCRYLNAEVSGEHPLAKILPRGVAFHHAGLSDEARYLVERLVEHRFVKIICATTTLAHGVHFPLSAAAFEGLSRRVYKRGWRSEDLKPWEFWNIAGRVGRTLEDALGVVALVTTNQQQVDRAQAYLRNDAMEVSSTLLDLLQKARDWGQVTFCMNLLERVQSASAFLQYLVHALAVSGKNAAVADLEGILRASLVFEQARAEDPESADELIRLARQYLGGLVSSKGRFLDTYAKWIDGTGFSSLSMDYIMTQWGKESADKWGVDKVFPNDGSTSEILVRVVNTLRQVPEIRLGTDDPGALDVGRLARVTAMWVNGVPLRRIAEEEYGGDLLKCTHHIYGTIINKIPWGFRAIQRVAFRDEGKAVWDDLSLLPAMMYHGVRSKEALALRMLSVPRIVAEGLARQAREDSRISVSEIPTWLDNSTDEQWEEALPRGVSWTGHECKLLWEVLDGRSSWNQAFDLD